MVRIGQMHNLLLNIGRPIDFHPPAILTATCMRLSQEQEQEWKLWMCVLLQGIAEQDPDFARRNCENPKYELDRVVSTAKAWVKGEEFVQLCDKIGVSAPDMRRLAPARAHKAYEVLRTPDFSLEDAAGVLRETLKDAA